MILRVRLALILVLLVAMTILLLPVQILAIRLHHPFRRRLPNLWHRIASRLIGLKVNVHGEPARHDGIGVLIAANHVSWLDIVALGDALTRTVSLAYRTTTARRAALPLVIEAVRTAAAQKGLGADAPIPVQPDSLGLA